MAAGARAATQAPSAPRLRDRLRDTLRLRHASPRTEAAYGHRVRRFVVFHERRHPADMGAAEIAAFLNHPAVEGRVAASTQNQALNALGVRSPLDAMVR